MIRPVVAVEFVHLHNHTEYSLLDGACRCQALCERAKEYGMTAVAMTDHGAMFGTVEFYLAARRIGVKPLIGCELYMAPGSRTVKEGGEKNSNHHILALARNLEGYHNLIKLCSLGYTTGFYYKPRIDLELLERYGKGLLVTSACLKGAVARAILEEDETRADAFIGSVAAIVGRENFFLEIMDHGLEDQPKANEGALRLARRHRLKVLATNDVHYLNKGDHEMHDVLLCIGTGKKLSEEKRLRYASPEFYFKTPEEMQKSFVHLPEALSNTLLAAEMCDVEVPLAKGESDNSKYPRYPPPEEHTSQSYLRELTEKGLRRRYGERLEDSHVKQADYELEVIHKTGFDDYFLIVWDFINYARGQAIPVGPGRGSGAGSIVAFCLGITDLDPVEHKLIFERFLNIERLEPPDFDIDFCTKGRQQVVEYVRAKYGAENVCNIATFGALKAKNAIRDVGRVLDVPLERVNMVCGLVSDNQTIDAALENNEQLRRLAETEGDIAETIKYARQIEGLHRNTSVHASAIIITDRPVSDYAPVFTPGAESKELISQFAMNDVTASGLLKMDLLGLKNLTVIDNAGKMIRRNHGVEIDWDHIPRSDPKTYEFLRMAQTTGVFQLESPGMRDLVRQLGPTCYTDIAAIIALFRPGPMANIPLFLESKRNPERVKYPHPILEGVLRETYGVIVYQEQVMQIAQEMAGFSLGRADILRKAMGKKKAGLMEEMKVEFLEGARGRGIAEADAVRVWDLMARFAEYGFNKAHTVAYAEVAFRTAYLKAHYPVEFMAALMTNDMDDTDKMSALFAEAREMGIKVLPPDINESHADFTVVKGAIRFGLAAIKNVGEEAVRKVIAERDAKGPFTGFQNFCERTSDKGVNSRMIECLIKVGAFDSIGYARARLFAGMTQVLEAAQMTVREREAGQMSLFGDMQEAGAGGVAEASLPPIPEWSDREKLEFEKELTGFFISGHPLDAFAVDIRSFSTANTADFAQLEPNPQAKIVLIGQIADVRRITTKTGEPMAFARIEDFHGNVEMVIFPRQYPNVESSLVLGALVCVRGTVNERNGRKSLVVDDLSDAEAARARLAKFLDVALPVGSISADNLGLLKQTLRRHTGRCKVRIKLETAEGPVTVQTDKVYGVEPSSALIHDVEGLAFAKTLAFAEK